MTVNVAGLQFNQLREKNVARCVDVFHSVEGWTPAEWLMATTGELGELANLLKKVHRGDFPLEEVKDEVAKELADVVIYIDLLAARLKVDLGAAIVQKFNEVSDRRNSKIKL